MDNFTQLLQNTIRDGKSLIVGHNKFPRNSWFDKDCKHQKRIVNTTASIYKRNPNNYEAKRNYFNQRKTYKSGKKRVNSAFFHAKLLILRSKKPKEFWKIISDKVMKEELPISVNILAEYFKDLYSCRSSSAHTHYLEYIEDDILDNKMKYGQL